MIIIMFFASLLNSAQAGAVTLSSLLPKTQSYSCTIRDTGWEEHWRGHSSCAACVAKHGHCVEICSETEYECRILGQDPRDPTGYQRPFYGRGDSQWDAEDRAMWECRRYGYLDCKRDTCDSRSREVSRRYCN